MKLKYRVKQRTDGRWYVYKNANVYWTTPYDSKEEAVKQSLITEGLELVDKLDDVQKRLETIPGFISLSDPFGWRA